MTLLTESPKYIPFLLILIIISRAIRMEDVVYTLNNIMDDIDRMYAGPTSAVEDVPMEEVS